MLAIVTKRAGERAPGEVSFAFVGQRVRELRRERNLTQEQLGTRVRPRMSRQAIGAIEAGGNTDLKTLSRIARAMGVRLSALLEVRPRSEEAERFFAKLDSAKRPVDLFRALADAVDQIDRTSDRKGD